MTLWSRADSSASHTYEVRDDDIVFVDLLMPKVSGVQVLEQLARQGVKSTIVLMSGHDHSLREAETDGEKTGPPALQACSTSRSVCRT